MTDVGAIYTAGAVLTALLGIVLAVHAVSIGDVGAASFALVAGFGFAAILEMGALAMRPV